MTTRSPLLLGFVALVLTACAMAMGSPHASVRAAPVGGVAEALPFACALEAREEGGSVALEGRVTARKAVTLSYELTVRGPGVASDQSGEVALEAGETARLGEAVLSGRLAGLDATLSVTSGGRRATCPLQPG